MLKTTSRYLLSGVKCVSNLNSGSVRNKLRTGLEHYKTSYELLKLHVCVYDIEIRAYVLGFSRLLTEAHKHSHTKEHSRMRVHIHAREDNQPAIFLFKIQSSNDINPPASFRFEFMTYMSFCLKFNIKKIFLIVFQQVLQ